MTIATDYNEQVMGTINFVISYDKNKNPRHTIVQLIENIIKNLNVENEPMCNDNFDVHFSVGLLENDIWYELNGLIQEAYNKRNQDIPQYKVINRYLNREQLKRFNTLSNVVISKEAFKE